MLEYVDNCVQFDRSIGKFQGIEWNLADATKRLQATWALTYSAGQAAVEAGRTPDRLNTAVAKLYASETVESVVSSRCRSTGRTGISRATRLSISTGLLGAGASPPVRTRARKTRSPRARAAAGFREFNTLGEYDTPEIASASAEPLPHRLPVLFYLSPQLVAAWTSTHHCRDILC